MNRLLQKKGGHKKNRREPVFFVNNHALNDANESP
jgi:hypothetical protein